MEAWQWVTTIIILYSLIVVGLGYVAWRRFKRTVEDFFLLSRRVGFLVLFLTLAATYHSAFAFLTSVAVFSSSGISFWVAASLWTTLAAVAGYVLGVRFHKIGKARGHITPADLLSDYYESEAVRLITAITQATFVIAYMVVQAIGLGIILSVGSAGKIPFEWASLFFMGVTIFYLVVGGNRAAFWTDALQGVWMYIGVWGAGLYILYKFFPGLGGLMDQVRQVNPKLLTMNWPVDLATSFIIVFSVGVILLPHMWLRYYSARDKTTLRLSSAGMALYVSSYYIPAALVGLAAAVFNATGLVIAGKTVLEPGFIQALVKTYGSRDAVMAYMVYTLTPPVFAGFLLAGAASAAMSTLDSLLGATSMVLTRDLYQRYFRPKASEQELVLVGRLWIIIWGLIAWYFTIKKPGLIFDIVALSASGALQFLPAVIGAVFPSKRAWFTKAGVIAGTLVGLAVNIALCNRFPIAGALGITGYHPAVAGTYGLIVNFIVALLVSAVTKPVSREKRLEYYRILSS
ncbi:MAG: sodium:solute symporter family protein [Desulfurococcales archaeon]|nr:sodium:solute symporter family protein [Desulfurococcales archaeon]